MKSVTEVTEFDKIKEFAAANAITEPGRELTLAARIYDDIEKNYPNMKKGIFVSNDTHANILLNILIKNKKKIPDEYEIIGFDNSPISVESIIPITTVNQDINKIADTAMKLILRQINSKNRGNSVKLENITIDTDLIIRDTTS